MTTVGLLHLEFHLPQAGSLKDKRRRVKSFKDRVAHRFNVSIAEVASLDDRRRAVLAVAMVANDRRFTQSCLDKIVDYVRLDRSASLVDYELEVF